MIHRIIKINKKKENAQEVGRKKIKTIKRFVKILIQVVINA